jgi:hypothetical protein
MKKLMFAFCLMLGAAVAVNAQDTTSTTTPSSEYNTQGQDQDQDKEAIAASELPAAVRASLEGQDYSGWTVGQAYRKMKDGKTVYAVEMKQGAETKMVKFDEQGNKLKEKDKGKDKDKSNNP